MPVVRWRFVDVYETGFSPFDWTFDINPNDGGSPNVEKNFNIAMSVGPRQGIILQEGSMAPPAVSFSGVILTQEHYETFETWFVKRVVLDLYDDLERQFRGALSSFHPKRVRKPYNFWYHTYDAEFKAFAYRNATGNVIYGRF